MSVFDKVAQQEQWIEKRLIFLSTKDIIKGLREGKMPNKIMMTFHPQRWHSNAFAWLKELVVQNTKNEVKRVLVSSSAE